MSTGLNFLTQTIINSNKDLNSTKHTLEGVKTDQWLFKAIKAGPTKDGKVEKGNDIFRVKRDFVFEKDNIQCVRKAEAHAPVMTKASIDIAKLFKTLADGGFIDKDVRKLYMRINVSLGLEGSEEFLYASPWIQKNLPLWADFEVVVNLGEVKSDAAKVAEKLATDIKKDLSFHRDHHLLNVSVKEEGSSVLNLEGADEFQRIRNISVVVYNDYDGNEEVVTKMTRDKEDEESAIKLEVFGNNGFGTYGHVIRELRLPTMDNLQHNHLRLSETPQWDGMYNQYIIDYKAPSSNDGWMAVGQRLESHTQHVFWVNQTVSEEFEKELTNVHSIDTVTTINDDGEFEVKDTETPEDNSELEP